MHKKDALQRVLRKEDKYNVLQRLNRTEGKKYSYATLVAALKTNHPRKYSPQIIEAAEQEAFEVLKEIVVALEYDRNKLSELLDSIDKGKRSL